ncbi:MAG TPA: type II secretion system F family protein, partial [Isosphaeraceae bacterium]|nr:type II secretion system F family protein [Isosphaeraceae bacterium]
PLRGREAAEVARQMGEMAASGLPLGGGLRAVALELRPGDPLQSRLKVMADDLDAGMPLNEVMASQDSAFPGHFQGVVEAGVRTGRLPELLGEFAAHDRFGQEMHRRIWLGLFYPLVLLGLCVLLMAAFSIAGRELLATLRDFGVTLPGVTMALLEVAESLGAAGWWVVFGPLLALGLLALLARGLFSAHERRRLVRALPLFGPLSRWISLAEFCRVLSFLVEADVPLPEALPMAGRSTRDDVLVRGCESAALDLSNGRSLGEALVARRVLPEGFGRFLSWAEGYRSLPESLLLASEMFEARASSQADFLVGFLTSIILALVLWGIALAVMFMLWPMMTFINMMSGSLFLNGWMV